MAIIGAASLILLPVALELAIEFTRNANASPAMLWASSNLIGVVFVLVEGALREGSDADPPYSMHRAIMFHGIVVVVAATLINLMEGRQVRRSADELAHAHREFVAGHEMVIGEVPAL
ncbi:hypothetical protein FOMPIDRAFT_1051656 [Fomitopsis schrenkii]|uniref:Uncharacterized protein n=1 Tax=Fomitopsis schrenkii TaxID=2126942 RepID=S8DZ66_FOMSC|nr:hypothetical protein FOMPIDRAFT_1051656 [Fomitopsis schrenkii]